GSEGSQEQGVRSLRLVSVKDFSSSIRGGMNFWITGLWPRSRSARHPDRAWDGLPYSRRTNWDYPPQKMREIAGGDQRSVCRVNYKSHRLRAEREERQFKLYTLLSLVSESRERRRQDVKSECFPI